MMVLSFYSNLQDLHRYYCPVYFILVKIAIVEQNKVGSVLLHFDKISYAKGKKINGGVQ